MGCKTVETAAAAAAKTLRVMSNSATPWTGHPPGSPVPRILQARILERVAISFYSRDS